MHDVSGCIMFPCTSPLYSLYYLPDLSLGGICLGLAVHTPMHIFVRFQILTVRGPSPLSSALAMLFFDVYMH